MSRCLHLEHTQEQKVLDEPLVSYTMKHSWKITAVLMLMFLAAQLIGLFVISSYNTPLKIGNQTVNEVPYGMAPPEVDAVPGLSSIIFSFVLAVAIIFLLMKFKAATFLRLWFFFVVVIAIGIVINLVLIKISPSLSLNKLDFSLFQLSYSELISFILALPLAYSKVFRRDILIHNISELLIYPGISVVFVPILNIWTVIVLLVLISAYDIYAVWHSGIMQKMAKYQINELKFFAGFFVPYIRREDRLRLEKIKSQKLRVKEKQRKASRIKVNLAILGGGDVIFPLITAGVVMLRWGLLPALMITLGATIALSLLLYFSEKGKFYPAMPFITAGCLAGLGVGWLMT